MICAKEIQKAITSTIRNGLRATEYADIPIVPDDDDEDVRRPSIRVRTETKYSMEMLIKKIETSAEVYFYAENPDRYETDCLEVQEFVEDVLLRGISIGGEELCPTDIDCTMSGGVLAVSFAAEYEEICVSEDGIEFADISVRRT